MKAIYYNRTGKAQHVLKIDSFRQRFLIVLGILLVSNLVLAYVWIPSSHFIYVMWSAIALFCISLYNHIKT